MSKTTVHSLAALAFVLGSSIAGSQALAFCIYNKMKYDDVHVWKGHTKVKKSKGKSCKNFRKGSFEHRLTGRCYTCPSGYKRSLKIKISSNKACVKGKLLKKKEYEKATYVGSIPLRSNKFEKTIKPGKRACCNWLKGGCNHHMTKSGKLRFSTNLTSSCKIPDRAPQARGGPAPTPAIQCGTLKFSIQAGGSAHIFGRKSGSTSGSFRAVLYDHKGEKTDEIIRRPASKAVPAPGQGR